MKTVLHLLIPAVLAAVVLVVVVVIAKIALFTAIHPTGVGQKLIVVQQTTLHGVVTADSCLRNIIYK